MAAHVGQKQHPRARGFRFCLKVFQVDHQIFGNLHEDRRGAERGNRPGHRREREGIRQHPIPRANPRGAQGAAHRIAARGDGEAIFRPGESGKVDFQRRGLADLAGRDIVAMQPPRAQHGDGGGNRRLVYRFLLGEIAGEDRVRHVSFLRISIAKGTASTRAAVK